MPTLPYSMEELHSMGPQRRFAGDASEAAFLLGGIGTGNVSLGARGELRDWEIFNKPGKGNKLPYTFFAIRISEKGRAAVGKVLESRIRPPFSRSHGFNSNEAAGLPRFEESHMRAEYPFAHVDFEDSGIPVKVSLEAFTPFIPLNPDDSGIPCAILRYKVTNISDGFVDVSLAGTIANAVGFNGTNIWGGLEAGLMGGNKNEARNKGGISGLYMYSDALKQNHLSYGSMCLMTPCGSAAVKPYWMNTGWFDGIQDFWDDFMDDGMIDTGSGCSTEKQANITDLSNSLNGSVLVPARLGSGEARVFTFIISWYFPNRPRGWYDVCPDSGGECGCKIARNHYSRHFKDAWEVSEYVLNDLARLEGQSRLFCNALFNSTLPSFVLDAVASNITVLRSPTCFWLEDGSFFGWEGCFDAMGCCDGTCTHVWNYAQTAAFLFPSLERSMRNTEFNKETDEKGKMNFRAREVFDLPKVEMHPAADGQLGSVIRLYREWKISGDGEFLKKAWDGAKRALNFAFSYWDSDGDFVLDSQQHNTYDIEFYGPNSLVSSIFLGALKAGAEMADAMGDGELAGKYAEAFEKGSLKTDEMLWGGEYYVQAIDDVNKYKYQYGSGCLSDQLLGQFMSHVAGLGYVLPQEHVKKAIGSVFKYNFRVDFTNHHNVQRTYVLNDEKGLLLCSWPKGGRPGLPFVYCDEVWTGFEYQVAAHLIYEGFVNEGLSIVKAVRERHDGYRRNPWNEVECGHHYARSLSSWGVLTALCGFECDMVKGAMRFSPRINADDFRSFWSTGRAWGTYSCKLDMRTGKYESSIEVLYGDLGDVQVITDIP